MALVGCCALAVAFAGSAAAAAGPATIKFKESNKGATFRYVDVAPQAKKEGEVSPGDELVISNPLESGGKKIGHLRALCVATNSAKKFINVTFICTAMYVLDGKGTLAAQATLKVGKDVKGAIVGGTGSYAGARGTFLSTELSNGSGNNTTITLE
ncbi:MAG: dirigent protein [Solirubrobacterales bacterium]